MRLSGKGTVLALLACALVLLLATGAAAKRIVGSGGTNIINGTIARDDIFARGGNDVVWARGGNDFVYGQRGADILRATSATTPYTAPRSTTPSTAGRAATGSSVAGAPM